jgi:hypothetical protein
MKKLINKITQFHLTAPIAIIIGSFIISFHYVWINKYEFITLQIPNLDVTYDTNYVLVINKWTNRQCYINSAKPIDLMNSDIELENPIPSILECQIWLSDGSIKGKQKQDIVLP